MKRLCLGILVIISIKCQGYLAREVTSTGGHYSVKWDVICNTKEIEFTVTAKTKGYVGFGIGNPHAQRPAKSDIVIGGVNNDGTTYFTDRHFEGRKTAVDSSQDWFLISGFENDTHTVLRFKRLLDTGDDVDDIAITSGPLKISWAVGKTDEITDHGRDPNSRGYLDLNIMSCDARKSVDSLQRRHLTLATLTQNLYDLEWEIDSVNNEIEFFVNARTRGWVGFGLSYDGKMANSDMVIGGVFANGSHYFTDLHGPGQTHGGPVTDVSQDWTLISAEENNISTMLRFKRKLDTGDAEDIPVTNDVKYVIWSLGSSDDISYHGDQRGSFPIQLIDREPRISNEAFWSFL